MKSNKCKLIDLTYVHNILEPVDRTPVGRDLDFDLYCIYSNEKF